MTQQPQNSEKTFLAALFDFSLTTFVALRFLKVIYIIVTVLIAIAMVGVFIGLVSEGTPGIIAAIILVPLTALVYLIVVRVSIEIIAVLFRIGESTAAIAAHLAPDTVVGLGTPGGYAETALPAAPAPAVSPGGPVPPAPPVTPTTGYPSVPPPSP